MNLKFCTSVGKGLKLKVRRFGANSYVCRSYRGKTGRRGLFAPLILNRVNCCQNSRMNAKETTWITRKKSADYLARLSRSKTGTFSVQSARDAILERGNIRRLSETIFCKSINTWKNLKNLHMPFCFPIRHPICSSYDFCGVWF